MGPNCSTYHLCLLDTIQHELVTYIIEGQRNFILEEPEVHASLPVTDIPIGLRTRTPSMKVTNIIKLNLHLVFELV